MRDTLWIVQGYPNGRESEFMRMLNH